MLLLLAAQRVDAQFYKQNDSIARIIIRGVVPKQLTQTVELQANKKTVNKRSKSKSTKDTKTVKKRNKKAVAKPAKKKSAIVYTGRKYRLGERIIMRGDSGNDVKALATILVNKLFLEEKDIIYTADGGVLYDGEIVRAVRLFQKVSDIYDDGIVAKPTLKALRRRN